ncbi:hypothetical protein T484DRAFT_1665185, partial [Baffinella frigidus]
MCPLNAVSVEGSTGRSSCLCLAGYGGDAGSGEECVACDAGTFKPFDGPAACASCPANVESADGGRSCGCGLGNWSTSSKLPECAPCEAGTYKDTTDASGCTACPPNAVSAEESTARSNCQCPAGYTGDAGAGDSCVPCEAGTYKAVSGSAECTACP